MNLAGHTRHFPRATASGLTLAMPHLQTGPRILLFPVLSRSLSLLKLLLDDSAIDLELASVIIALDPGLAFDILQVANRDAGDCLWQLPLAVVAAGRDAVQKLLRRVPEIEALSRNSGRLKQLAVDAVARASAAYVMARELFAGTARKAYLSGLLFELRSMGRLALPELCSGQLLPAMGRALPPPVMWAAMGKPAPEHQEITADTLGAMVGLAEKVLRAQQGDSQHGSIAQLAESPLWNCCGEIERAQRAAVLARAGGVARWAAASLHAMQPWEFMARLEQRKGWE